MAGLFFANILYSINSAKILGIFPVPARSHFNFNRQIMYSLLEAGHQVTFVSPFQEPNPSANFTYIVPKRTSVANSENVSRTDIMNTSVAHQMRLYRPMHFQFSSDLMKTSEIQVSYLVCSPSILILYPVFQLYQSNISSPVTKIRENSLFFCTCSLFTD